MRIAKIKWAMPHCYALIFFHYYISSAADMVYSQRQF